MDSVQAAVDRRSELGPELIAALAEYRECLRVELVDAGVKADRPPPDAPTAVDHIDHWVRVRRQLNTRELDHYLAMAIDRLVATHNPVGPLRS